MNKKHHSILFWGFLLLSFYSCHSGSSETNSAIADSTVLKSGENLFARHCSACHNLRQDGIGPALGDAGNRLTALWTNRFIHNPKNIIASGDRHSNELLAKYKVMMPSFENLPDSVINDIVAYLQAQKKSNKKGGARKDQALNNPVPQQIPLSELKINLRLITQFPATTNDNNLPLARITKMGLSPGSNDLFILDLRGKLYRLKHNKTPILYMDLGNLRSRFIQEPGLATGFGSFAFHPGFNTNGLIYTTHSEVAGSAKADFRLPDSLKSTLQWVLTEWKIDDVHAANFSGRGRELLRIDMEEGSHGVQEIIFNPQSKKGDKDYGLLYIGIGDGGSAEDGFSFLLDHKKTVLGTLLRIDPLGTNSANGKYSIPADNPFFRDSSRDLCKEIYAYGFRNPHRITWTKSGLMLVCNIGQGNIESIDMVKPGNDFGWPAREGNFSLDTHGDLNNVYALPSNDSMYHFTYPIAEYDHDEGKAICGGYEYQGSDIPALRGKFLFGDIPSGRLFCFDIKDIKTGKRAPVSEWKILMNGEPETLKQLCGRDRVDLRFGRDSNGEMYILTKADGKLYKLINRD